MTTAARAQRSPGSAGTGDSEPPTPAPAGNRLGFLDGMRGLAIILMVLNHTSRDWMDGAMGWGRYHLVYSSLLLPAAIFLFLVGFCLPISFHRRPVSEAFAASAAKYFRRGVPIVAAGYLLNVVVLAEPVWYGGVLHTIGLAIILLGPAVPLLRHRATRWLLVGAAGLLYLAFGVAHPALVRWAAAYPALSRALFNDFPPWPWLAPALLGLVVGWSWLEARARGAAAEERFFKGVAAASLLLLLAYAVWAWWFPATAPFGFRRDFSLNRHWTPRGATVLLVLGAGAWLLAAMYWVMEVRRTSLGWLVLLGQTALMLYFVHQIIEYTIVAKLLGVRFTTWAAYCAANAAFVVLLVYLGRAWLRLEPRIRRAVPLLSRGA